MSIKLRELIRQVRAAKTAAEERAVVAKESALIRNAFRDESAAGFRHRNVAKLLYIHMLGYPTHFGQVESLKLISSHRFAEKRIGYLGLMLLLDEKQEVLVLVTNSLKRDLSDPNPYVVGLALCSLGNIASADMARDLSNEVGKLFENQNPYIRKKAASCAVRIVRKVPELVEDFVNPADSLLQDKNHAVLLAGVTLITEMIRIDPVTVKHFRKQTGQLVKILKNMVLAGYVSEYDVCGITDPFLQCKIIALLRLLGTGSSEASQEMNDILAQVAINTDSAKTPGNAILYECVQTIMSIEAENGLRVLAINILGRFLGNRDNNIRYVALNTLCKVANTDTEAISRHRNVVVDCLKDSDLSIRRRALDLIYALVNKDNVKALVKELLNYLALPSSDKDFKADLTDKICLVVDRHAPSKRWHIDTIISVLAIAGSYTREQVVANLISLIIRTKSLHAYAVHKIYAAVQNASALQLPLVHAAIWCVGEFGNLLTTKKGVDEANEHEDGFKIISEREVLDFIEAQIKSIQSTEATRAYALNALAKLSARFSPESLVRISKLVSLYDDSILLELQQRSIEYEKLLGGRKFESLREKVVGVPIAEPKKAAPQAEAKGAAANFSDNEEGEPTDDEGEGDEDEDEDEDEEDGAGETDGAKKAPKPAPAAAAAAKPAAKPAAAAAAAPKQLDILSGLFDPTPTQPAVGSAAADPLAALFGGPVVSNGASAPAPAPAPAPAAAPAAATTATAGPPASNKMVSKTVLQKGPLTLAMNIKHPAAGKVQVMAVFTSSHATDITGLDFKVAVPKYIKLQMKPASATSVPAGNSGRTTQVFQLENTMHGSKPLMIRCKLDYKLDGNTLSEQFQVDNFDE
jgi:AP-1 complex subunit gamma-1